jgi:hypothetical protein
VGLKRYRGRPCPYCSRSMGGSQMVAQPNSPTRDHIVPRWADGQEQTVCCFQCNNDKGDYFLSEWIEILRRKGDPRLPFVAKFAADHPYLALPNGKKKPGVPGRIGAPMTDAQRLLAELRGT